MKLSEMQSADLELLSNGDIAALLLKENKKPMNTPTIFKQICSLLGYSDEEYAEKIGDFYTSLTTDKRFLLLDSAEWDLRDNHSVKVDVDDDEEEDVEIEEDEEEEIEEETDEMDESLDDDDDLDVDDDDDIEDLAIVDEEDIDA
ncbi:MAG: DNA-directed RNA polymerase subunit delta [Bacilli bacterium]|nr:DNA-directed RNA polymerase subunit delta [Bacilli bacterium]